MPIHLTKLPVVASSHPLDAIVAYDALRPDGLTKEIIARAAALELLKCFGDAAWLAQLHDQLDPDVCGALAKKAGVVNPVVKRIIALDALDTSAPDAAAALAGAVYDVVNNKHLEIPAPTAIENPSCDKPAAHDDLDGIDLLSPEFEMFRVVLTRTLMMVRPALYAEYRTIKDSGSATARDDAYGFVFGSLAKVIGKGNA